MYKYYVNKELKYELDYLGLYKKLIETKPRMIALNIIDIVNQYGRHNFKNITIRKLV